MTALEEVRAGELGEAFVAVLYRQVAVVAAVRRFPPPEGYGSWTKDAVLETAHDYLTSPQAHRRFLELAARVDSDSSLESALSEMVRNFLRERGRKTTVGKLMRRLRTVLQDDDRFLIVEAGQAGAGMVALASGPTDPSVLPVRDLVDAARAVTEVSVVKWSPSARREGPVADSDSLRRLSHAVVEAARGSVERATLAEVIATRLGIDPRSVPAAIPVEDIDSRVQRDRAADGRSGGTDRRSERAHLREEPATDSAASSLEREEIAAALLEQLSDRERLVLAWLHETVRTIADQTGLPVSTAGAVKQRVTDKLRTMLVDVDPTTAEWAALAARDAARQEVGLDPV
jgi:hypothetical protein